MQLHSRSRFPDVQGNSKQKFLKKQKAEINYEILIKAATSTANSRQQKHAFFTLKSFSSRIIITWMLLVLLFIGFDFAEQIIIGNWTWH